MPEVSEIEMLLLRATSDIKMLRRQNDIMAARLDMFDSMMQIFKAPPPPYPGMAHSPDTAYDIDQYLQRKTTKEMSVDNP